VRSWIKCGAENTESPESGIRSFFLWFSGTFCPTFMLFYQSSFGFYFEELDTGVKELIIHLKKWEAVTVLLQTP